MTLFGIGYYGFSDIPGLIPIDVPVPGDTIDPRQNDRTHTSILIATDTWQFSSKQQLQFSGFFRTYPSAYTYLGPCLTAIPSVSQRLDE
ncbi:MAG TPA: hypothetical protein VJN92_10320 [Candidatus Acidoferrum sp.]|nr:hypothetical protein [Candidatus Acidoferrum sp.]